MNKLPDWAAKSKIAIMKRVCRKNPTHGFCPVPESKFYKADPTQLRRMEDVLHYFHVTCQAAVAAAFDTSGTAAFLANVDCALAEAFVTSPAKDLKKNLLEATAKYYRRLTTGPEQPPDAESWMLFPEEVEPTELESAVADEPRVLPRVLVFDEATGMPTNAQEQITGSSASQNIIRVLPWREWMLSQTARDMGSEEEDIASISKVMRMLRLRGGSEDASIAVVYGDVGPRRVLAQGNIPEGGLMLPPCTSKNERARKTCEHPLRVGIAVTALAQEKDSAVAEREPERIYYVVPEWKQPALEAAMETQAFETYAFDGKETMHPIWAVRRLTHAQAATVEPRPVKMSWVQKEFSLVAVGSVCGDSVSTTYQVTVPFLSNVGSAVPHGVEIYIEVEQAATKEKQRGWRDQVKEDQKPKKLKKAKEAQTAMPELRTEI